MVLPMPPPTSQQIAAREAMEISTALTASLEPTGTDFSTNSYNSATHQPSLNYPSSSSLILPPNESTPFSAVTKSTATTTFHSDATSALIPALPNSFPSLVETSADRVRARAPPQPSHDPRNAPVPTLDPRLSQQMNSTWRIQFEERDEARQARMAADAAQKDLSQRIAQQFFVKYWSEVGIPLMLLV